VVLMVRNLILTEIHRKGTEAHKDVKKRLRFEF